MDGSAHEGDFPYRRCAGINVEQAAEVDAGRDRPSRVVGRAPRQVVAPRFHASVHRHRDDATGPVVDRERDAGSGRISLPAQQYGEQGPLGVEPVFGLVQYD